MKGENMKGFHIRQMNLEEVQLAVDWAAKEGWNPGLNDAQQYFLADPSGFLLGSLDGEPIACISVIKYDHSFGFLGFYIVKPEYRGKGYGIQIWRKGMAYLEGCNVALDGVVDQQDNYKRSGFVLSHRNIRYQSLTASSPYNQETIKPLRSVSLDLAQHYLLPFFPSHREAFYQSWLFQPNSVALYAGTPSDIKGIGVIRPCKDGYKIGPLFADSMSIANMLYTGLTSSVNPEQPVFLDVPETNKAALELASNHQMTACFETARMYTKGSPDIALGRTFGVTSFEIG
ncbi:hypothetical protein VSAK1_21829 [Vibrio mediterranei AK1]|nr:hypothetical protein VSAK1_21829 [Vibrio mediterranei AK1]